MEHGTCISDVPVGCLLTIYTIRGNITGRCSHNYGSSIEIVSDDGSLTNTSNSAISGFTISDKESVACYRQAQSKSNAEFRQMLDRIKQ